jgi:hypothetical protein
MDSMKENGLTFPQRHWLILCILVAILSPIVVHALQTMAHKTNYNQAMETKPVQGGAGGLSPSGGAVAAGDSAGSGKDTSYKVPVPPQSK